MFKKPTPDLKDSKKKLTNWGRVPSPPLGGAAFSHLLKGGTAWSPSSLGGVAFPSPFRGAAFPPLGVAAFPALLGGAAFLSILWVVVLSPLSSVGSLLGFPQLGGVAVFFFLLLLVVLPSSSSCGWSCFSPLQLGGAARSPPSVGWCCCPKSKRKDAK